MTTQTRLAMTVETGVAVVRFSNPPDDYMDDQTDQALGQLLDSIEHNAAIRVVVLTGASSDVFVRHYDVRELELRGRALAKRGLKFSLDRPVPETRLHASCRRIEQSAKPFIAAINGTAMGGGFELALSCDLRLVQDGPFSLGLPEVNIGLLPGGGGTQRLTRLVGPGRALELMLLGRTFSPRDAVAMGLASECVDGPVLSRALDLAAELAGKSDLAMAHIKRLVRGAAHDMTPGLAAERTLFCDLMTSPEAIDRMHAMNQGRVDLRDRRAGHVAISTSAGAHDA